MAGLLEPVELGEAVGQGEVLGEDRLDEADDLHDLGARVGAHRRQGPLEVLATADRVVGATRHRVVADGVDGGGQAVVEQRRDTAVRVVAECELLAVRQAGEDLLPRRADAEQEQPAHAEAVLGVGLGAGREHAQVDGRPGVDEGRVALDALGALEGLGHPLVGERREAGSLDPGPRTAHLTAQLGRRGVAHGLEVLARGDGSAVHAVDAEGDLQVRRHALDLEVRRRDGHPGPASQHRRERHQQRAGRRVELGQDGARMVWRGDEVAADPLGETADQGRDELLAEARHLPVEALGRHLVEALDGDVDGHAVLRRPRLELVRDRQDVLALGPRRRVVLVGDAARALAQEQLLGEGQQVGRLAPRLLPPRVEVAPRDDVGGNPLVVEGDQRAVVDDDVAPPRAGLELAEPLDEGGVVAEEGVLGVPVALDEGVADEEVAGQLGVDPAEADDAADDERHAVERDPLGRDGRAALARPARLGVLPLHEVLAELFGPHRVDAGVDRAPTAGSSRRAPRP